MRAPTTSPRLFTEHQFTRRLRGSLFDTFAAWLTDTDDAFDLHRDIRRKTVVKLLDATPIHFDHKAQKWQYPSDCQRWFDLLDAYDSLGVGFHEAVDVSVQFQARDEWVMVPYDEYADWIVMLDIRRGGERLAILYEPAPHRYGRTDNTGRGPGSPLSTSNITALPHRLIVAATTKLVGDELSVILRLCAP